MSEIKHLYWAFQSSQIENPKEKELKLFQNKYKKDFEKRELYEDEELQEKFRLNGWRNALFSEITSIILAFEHAGTLRVKCITGTEKDLLQTFVNLVKNDFQECQLVHFDAGIVLPYIGVRLQKNGFISSPHIGLKYQGYRPWDLKGLCIKQYFKGAGDYSYSLEEIADILTIDSEGIIPYEDEFTYHAMGDLESLNNSAIRKIEVLSQAHRKLFELSELKTVIVKEQVEAVEEVKPTNWLSVLYSSENLTKEIQEGLKFQFGGKRITKKDKENLFTILRGAWVHCNFENKDQDSKAIIAKKEKEITNFLETL